MRMFKKKEEPKPEPKEPPVEQPKAVSEYPSIAGLNRNLIEIHFKVYVQDGVIYTKRDVQVNRPVRSADIACVIAELEQLKNALLIDYGKGSLIARLNK